MEAIKFSDIIWLKKEIKIQELPIAKIRFNPYQPRKWFSRSGLEKLAVSISEFGVIQPVLVRKMSNSSYELVAGERRLKASDLLGVKTIPAVVVNIHEQESAFMALAENLQREPLHFLDEAEGIQNLIKDYGISLEEVSIRLGCSQSLITNKLKVLKLGEQAKRKVMEYHLPEQYARSIAKLPEEYNQLEVIEQVVADDLTSKGTEELVENTMARIGDFEITKREQKEKRLIPDMRLFTNSIRHAVDIIRKTGRQVFYESRQDGDYCEIVIKIHPKK